MFFKYISKNWYWLLDVKDDKVCVCQHKIMCKIWKSFVSRAWCKVSLCLHFYFPCIIGLKMNLQKYVLIYLIEMKDWMKIKILWRITVTDESSKIIFIINYSLSSAPADFSNVFSIFHFRNSHDRRSCIYMSMMRE